MKEARSTTVEERIQIAKDCIANGGNYGETALKFNVSYQQVYQWVKKFKEKGIGLQKSRSRAEKCFADKGILTRTCPRLLPEFSRHSNVHRCMQKPYQQPFSPFPHRKSENGCVFYGESGFLTDFRAKIGVSRCIKLLKLIRAVGFRVRHKQ